MATFTTWTALKTEIENDLASGSWRVKSYNTPAGQRVERDLDALLRFYGFVCEMAATESAASGVATRRTVTKFASGGSW